MILFYRFSVAVFFRCCPIRVETLLKVRTWSVYPMLSSNGLGGTSTCMFPTVTKFEADPYDSGLMLLTCCKDSLPETIEPSCYGDLGLMTEVASAVLLGSTA